MRWILELRFVLLVTKDLSMENPDSLVLRGYKVELLKVYYGFACRVELSDNIGGLVNRESTFWSRVVSPSLFTGDIAT